MRSFAIDDLTVQQVHNYLQHAIAPRPIALVSTICRNGQVNLSPFSFFNLFSANPPIVVFSPSRRVRDNTTKHTLDNLYEVRQCVVNMVNHDILFKVNQASAEYAKGVNEFHEVGLTELASVTVKPPRVAESPVQLECIVQHIMPLGKGPGAGNLVIAEVKLMHFSDDLLDDANKPIQQNFDLVARLGGDWYCRTQDLFELKKTYIIMPSYHTLGKIPRKRHTQFRKPDGGLYAEELVSTEGFSSVYSLVYHVHPPTMVKALGEPYSVEPKIAREKHLKHTSLIGFNIAPEDDYLQSRKPVLVNTDLHISLAAPRKSMTDYYYKNSQSDEVIFVHKGSGTLHTGYGQLKFSYGDYLVIPRGTIYQIAFDTADNRLFIIESFSPIRPPKRYLNTAGQLMEHAPYCERDIRRPENLETNDQQGDFKILIKKQGLIYPYIYGTHPFDFVGWDGFHYPWAFSIHDFEPITGRLHQPPPVHQTFEGHNFVICSFVPRKFDYHPLSIPAPYNHSNIDSDEVLYYVDGDFMSRKNVVKGQITLHPGGIPHGPAPGTVERSIGKEATEELAVMIDPFHPLMLTEAALKIEDENYYKSWLA